MTEAQRWSSYSADRIQKGKWRFSSAFSFSECSVIRFNSLSPDSTNNTNKALLSIAIQQTIPKGSGLKQQAFISPYFSQVIFTLDLSRAQGQETDLGCSHLKARPELDNLLLRGSPVWFAGDKLKELCIGLLAYSHITQRKKWLTSPK